MLVGILNKCFNQLLALLNQLRELPTSYPLVCKTMSELDPSLYSVNTKALIGREYKTGICGD